MWRSLLLYFKSCSNTPLMLDKPILISPLCYHDPHYDLAYPGYADGIFASMPRTSDRRSLNALASPSSLNVYENVSPPPIGKSNVSFGGEARLAVALPLPSFPPISDTKFSSAPLPYPNRFNRKSLSFPPALSAVLRAFVQLRLGVFLPLSPIWSSPTPFVP